MIDKFTTITGRFKYKPVPWQLHHRNRPSELLIESESFMLQINYAELELKVLALLEERDEQTNIG